MNELVKAKEFEIEETKAIELTKGLKIPLKEREVLLEEFDKISKLDVSAENIKKFKELRIKFKNNRTKGIVAWHKTTKAFFLAGGKFVDSIKNAEILINEQCEAKLEEAEKFQEIQEAKRISELTIKREAELEPFELEIIPPNLGSIDNATWEAMKLGYKASQDAKIKAEKEEAERIEKERLEAEKLEAERLRIEQLEKDRRFKTSRLVEYIKDYDTIVFAELSEAEFEKTCKSAIDARAKHEAEQEAIRVENEKLKAEAIKREEEAEKQRIEQKKIADKKEADRIKKEAEEKAERKRLQKIEDDKKAKLEEERRLAKEKADRLEREAEEKRQEEIKAEKERLAKAEADKQAELNKGDKDKRKDLLRDLEVIKTKYSFKSDKNKKMYIDVNLLIDKVINHIEGK